MNITNFNLRPGVTNKNQWQPAERKRAVPDKLRKALLTRDDNTCISCRHRALKWMHIHHIEEEDNEDPSNLCTLCPACHAVMHMGRSLQFGTIEIWKASLSQVEIVQATRTGIRSGLTLAEIKNSFTLKKSRRAPSSVEWANSLLNEMGPEPRAELPEPLCAIFIDFKRWQIEI